MNKLLEHFKRMQLQASKFISPEQYEPFYGKPCLLELNRAEETNRFINDMLYMLDGPAQREAEASVGNTYIELALRTESTLEPIMPLPVDYPVSDRNINRLLHAAMGLTTESGEFLDALKKHLFYGKPLDLVNLREEIGDIMWYLAIACDALGTDFETEQARNVAKLRKRYPEKFDAGQAIERDLDAERAILEK